MRKISKIELKIPIIPTRKRVAAYARISEEKEEPYTLFQHRSAITVPTFKKILNGNMQVFMQMKVYLVQQKTEKNFKDCSRIVKQEKLILFLPSQYHVLQETLLTFLKRYGT